MGACVGTLIFLGALVIVFNVLQARAKAAAAAARLADLTRRFGPDAAAQILNHRFWQGMTEEMLFESMGRAADVDESVLKTRVRRVYKYGQVARNRFATKVIVENGQVVGWENK